MSLIKNALVFGLLSVNGSANPNYFNDATERMREWQLLDESGKANIVSNELLRSPCWESLYGDESEIASGVVKIYQQLSVIDDQAIEKGVRRFWTKYCGRANQTQILNSSKVYVFLRVLYDVPATFPKKAMTEREEYSLGEFAFESSPGQMALLWPLKREANGRLVLMTTQSPILGPHVALRWELKISSF